jgi:hypothetical protein
MSSVRYASTSPVTLRSAMEHVLVGALVGLCFLGFVYRDMKHDLALAANLLKGGRV